MLRKLKEPVALLHLNLKDTYTMGRVSVIRFIYSTATYRLIVKEDGTYLDIPQETPEETLNAILKLLQHSYNREQANRKSSSLPSTTNE